MRIVLAFLVMGWVLNLIFAMVSREPFSIGAGVLYLAACVYGVFVRGPLAGLIGLVAIGIGLEAVFLFATHTYVPALALIGALFWSSVAILAGNMFSRE